MTFSPIMILPIFHALSLLLILFLHCLLHIPLLIILQLLLPPFAQLEFEQLLLTSRSIIVILLLFLVRLFIHFLLYFPILACVLPIMPLLTPFHHILNLPPTLSRLWISNGSVPCLLSCKHLKAMELGL